MSDLKKRLAKLEVIALPTMDRFILGIGLPTFKAMLDCLQEFMNAAKDAPRIGNKIDLDFNPPKEFRGHFLRWGRITGSEVFKKVLDS